MHQETSFSDSWQNYRHLATEIEVPDIQLDQNESARTSIAPHTLRDPEEKEIWELSLEEAIHIALSNSQVMRDLGGRVVSAPSTARSVFDPALQEANPLTGPEAALSAFDAQFNSSLFLEHTERRFNNIFVNSFSGALRDTANFRAEIAKQSAAGTQFFVRNITTRDSFFSPANQVPSTYETLMEAEFRHPLLQGGGLEFNRIAGPAARAGVYNGVLVARINTDVALADFEMGVRDLVRDVEQTYWELYFAYRDLDAKKRSRDAALDLWRVVESQWKAGSKKADAERESLVREQYYTAEAAVQEALAGNSTGQGGLYGTERRLRRLMGIAATDDKLIRPSDDPQLVEFHFDWHDSLQQSFWQRPELRRQQWMIKRRELELIAARNFRLGRLDLVSLYRWRGFGDLLFGGQPGVGGNIVGTSAFRDLFSGDLQDWQVGLQYTNPIGNRLGHTAVRFAELQLAREKAIYREQELQISHELADAFANLDRAYVVTKSNYNRRIAAYQQVKLSEIKVNSGSVELEFYLDALRRATIADNAFFRSLTDYHLALLQIHYARGSLLAERGIQLAEGPWSAQAHEAAAKESRRFGPYHLGRCYEEPCPISLGAIDRSGEGAAPTPEPPVSPSPEPSATPQPPMGSTSEFEY